MIDAYGKIINTIVFDSNLHLVEELTSFSVNTFTGVVGSFIVWWAVIKFYQPRLRFSSNIEKMILSENPSGMRYRFKFENYGRRNVVDIEVIIRVSIKGIRPNFKENNEIVYLPVDAHEQKRIAIARPINKDEKRPVFEILSYRCEDFKKDIYPLYIQQKATNNTLTLEDILNITDEVSFQIIFLGYDSFSGIRKYFESDTIYTKTSIIEGIYDRNNLTVNVIGSIGYQDAIKKQNTS